MGAFAFVSELSEGQSRQLATPEGWVNATGKSASSVAAASQNDFVYQPGGAAHDNVYSSWPLLVAAVNAVFGQRRILVDPTFAGDLGPLVPAGAWALNNVVLIGDAQSAGFAPSLTFQQGATIVETTTLFVVNLILPSTSTVPVMVLADLGLDFQLINGAIFSPSAPFFHVSGAGGASVNILANGGANLGDGTNPILQVDAPSIVNLSVLDAAILFASATTGTGAVDAAAIPGAASSFAAEFPTLADANVQFPQLAGFAFATQTAQLPFPIVQQFLVNQIGVGTVSGSDAIQTSDATPTDLPLLALGDATVPMRDHLSGHLILEVVARIPSTDATVTWYAEASFKNVGGGGVRVSSLLNVGGNALAFSAPTGGDSAAFAGATIAVAIVPPNPNAKGIQPQVTGLVATTIDWTVKATYFYTHA